MLFPSTFGASSCSERLRKNSSSILVAEIISSASATEWVGLFSISRQKERGDTHLFWERKGAGGAQYMLGSMEAQRADGSDHQGLVAKRNTFSRLLKPTHTGYWIKAK